MTRKFAMNNARKQPQADRDYSRDDVLRAMKHLYPVRRGFYAAKLNNRDSDARAKTSKVVRPVAQGNATVHRVVRLIAQIDTDSATR